MRALRTFALATCLALLAQLAAAETLYVINQMQAAVYAGPTLDGERLALVQSGEPVELLARDGAAAQVRLADGTEGWVEAALLTEEQPLATRIEALTAENERLRAAARSQSGSASELKTLKASNAELQAALDQAREEVSRVRAATRSASPRPEDDVPVQAVRRPSNGAMGRVLLEVLLAAGALGLGFWWGYSTLERRVRAKYGGLKVY